MLQSIYIETESTAVIVLKIHAMTYFVVTFPYRQTHHLLPPDGLKKCYYFFLHLLIKFYTED